MFNRPFSPNRSAKQSLSDIYEHYWVDKAAVFLTLGRSSGYPNGEKACHKHTHYYNHILHNA